MAATYRVHAKEVVFGNNKSMIGLFNGGSSVQILKVNRIWLLNNQVIVPATGVLITLELRLITDLTGGQRLTPVKNNLASGALDANILAAVNGTATDTTTLFKRVIWSGDEPAQNEYTQDTWQLIPNINVIWDSGYVDTNLEPLTLNPGQGVHVKCVTSTTATNLGNSIMEFTT